MSWNTDLQNTPVTPSSWLIWMIWHLVYRSISFFKSSPGALWEEHQECANYEGNSPGICYFAVEAAHTFLQINWIGDVATFRVIKTFFFSFMAVLLFHYCSMTPAKSPNGQISTSPTEKKWKGNGWYYKGFMWTASNNHNLLEILNLRAGFPQYQFGTGLKFGSTSDLCQQ